MGNTVPVVIQDKNGKTTTVHRRVDAKTAGSVNTVPAPSLTKSSLAETMSNDEVIDLFESREKTKRYVSIYHYNSPVFVQEAIDFFREDCPDSFNDALHLMTTGTQTAQQTIKATMSSVVDNIANACVKRSEGEDDWDAMLPSDRSLQRDFAYRWAAGNAVEEYGYIAHQTGKITHESYLDKVSSVCDDIDASMSMIHKIDRGEINNPEHWRGVAALAVANVLEDGFRRSQPLPDGALEFVEWAGQQNDLTDAIEIMRERPVFHPEDIQALIAQKRTTANSISSGIL